MSASGLSIALLVMYRFSLDFNQLTFIESRETETIVFSVESYLDFMIKMTFLSSIGIVSEGLLTPFLALNDGSFAR